MTDGTATQDMVYSFFVDHLLLRKCLSGKGMGITLLDEKTANVALDALVDLRSTQLSKEPSRRRQNVRTPAHLLRGSHLPYEYYH